MNKFNILMVLLAGVFALFMLISIFYLITALRYSSLIFENLFSKRVILALWISVASSTIVMLIALFFGIPISWVLANKDFKKKSIIETLIVDVPHSFPPGVVGTIYLLMFQSSDFIGLIMQEMGLQIINTFWAMVLVKTFISAPFLVSILTAKLREIRKSELEIISKSLGASDFKVFITITIPLSKKTIIAGSARCWARALGEIAGTIVFAGAIIPGITQTMPAIIVFEAQTSLSEALTLALILATFSITILVIVKVIMERSDK